MKSLINFPMQRTIFSTVPVFRFRIEIAGNSQSSRALTALTTHRRFAKLRFAKRLRRRQCVAPGQTPCQTQELSALRLPVSRGPLNYC